MDAKDLRTQSALSERSNDVTKYTQSGTAIQSNRNKSYQDIRSISSSKVDTSARPCAVIGPDRVVPPAVSTDAYVRKAPLDPWSCQDATYHHMPEYPNKVTNYQNHTRNISPRQTFQEDMQRIMVPASYNSVKTNSNNFPQLADRNVLLPKNAKINNAADAKYCDVPYTVNHASNNLKLRPEISVSNVNPVLVRPAPHGWASGGIRPQRAYGAPEMYPFPEYPSCAGPRPVPISRPHRTVQEDPGHIYSDSYYQESNIRYKPYPNIKERYPQTRYDYSSNYSNPFHPPPPFQPLKYDLSKPMPSHTYPGHPHFKYVSSRLPEPVTEGFHRPINQQGNYNPPFRNQIIHPTYGPLVSNFSQSKISPYSSDSSIKPITSNKLLYDNNGKMYVDYENSHKTFHPSENFYGNEPSRLHAMRNQVVIPNYPPVNMQSISAHVLYKKDQQVKHDYMNHYKNFDPSTNVNSPISRHLPQFSPSAIAISPTDSSTSNDTAHTQGTSLEDYGYISQSSTASVRSIDSSVNRVSHDYLGRYYDYRYGPVIRTPFFPKSSGSLHSSVDSKDKKGINVRQFLQMWNEGDDENAENSSQKEIVIQANTDDGSKTSKQTEALNNQEQLYVLGLVNVPSEELSKYEHIQKISKLPENIKGYNSIELLNQFEEVIESSNINCFKSPVNKEHKIPFKGSVQATGISPRPVSPLDVEAKISQSVIHKEVGCNFEIKPCSPKMSNVELAAPVRSLLDERTIEKVTNPHSNMTKSPISSRIDDVLESCKILKIQELRSLNENDTISSCKMINTQYSNNNSAKTNYSLQDLESNSGVSFASLPRLDNDIELNFPEVNQQFINANMGDSRVTTSKDLPTLEITEQMLLKSPKESLKLDIEINNRMSPSAVTEKERTKLSKYRKIKMSDGEIKGDNIDQKSLRTDSVIIKNPENTKRFDDIKAASPVNKLLDDNQQTPINLTSQSDMKTVSGFVADIKVIDQYHVAGGIPNDTAIDFSLNKNDDVPNVLTKQSFLQDRADDFIKKFAKRTKNNENYSFMPHDMTVNVADFQENDINSVNDAEFLKRKKTLSKTKNIVSNFNESKVLSPIHEKTTSEMAGIDIMNFEDVSRVHLSKNSNATTDSLNHELLACSVGEVKIEKCTSDTNFINILTQGSCSIDIEDSDKVISTGVQPSFDSNTSSKIEPCSQEKEHIEVYNIGEQCSVVQDKDNEIIEDKKFVDSKEELNRAEVYNSSIKEEINSQYESDNTGNVGDSIENIQTNFILQDTKKNVAEQIAPTIENNVNCNALIVNRIIPSGVIQTEPDISVSDNLREEKIETPKKFSRYYVDKTVRNNSENNSKQSETFDKCQIKFDDNVKENGSLRKYFKKSLLNCSKKLHSPQIQNLIIFNEGMCRPVLPVIKNKIDILSKTVLTNTFDAESSVNDDRNVKKCNETEARTEELPSTVSSEDRFSNKDFKFNEEMRDHLLDEENEASIVNENVSLELAFQVHTDSTVNYERNLNECSENETRVKALRPTIQEGDCSITNDSVKYEEVMSGPLILTENIEPCMVKEDVNIKLTDEYGMDTSVDIDLNLSDEIITNIDSLPSTSPNSNQSISNEPAVFNEDRCGPLLLTQRQDHGILQENGSTDSINQFKMEPSLDNFKIVNEYIENKTTVESLRLSLQGGDRDFFSNSIMSNEGECGPSIPNEKNESGNKEFVKFTHQFTDSSVDNDKNVKACSNAETTALQPPHLDGNRKLFSGDEMCGSLLLDEHCKSSNTTEEASDPFVSESYIDSDNYEKEEKADTGVEEVQTTTLDDCRSLSGDGISINVNEYLKKDVTLSSRTEAKFTSLEDGSLEFRKDDNEVQQKIPYINEFYDEIGDSDESTSINHEFTSKTSAKKIRNNPNEYHDSLKQNMEPLVRNITNEKDWIDHKNTNTMGETLEQSDINQHDDDSLLKWENNDTKILKHKNSEHLLTQRPLKRSLSDSALNSIYEDMHEGIDNVAFVWPFKRKKTNNVANTVESNFIAQNLCSIIQSNRRNSISSIYNEENVSFCILIDNNCIISEGNEEEKICYTDLSEDFLCEIQNNCKNEQNPDVTVEEQFCSEAENCECSDSLITECDQTKSIEDSWVDDIACVETVVSEDIAEDVMIGTSSPKDINLSDNEESGIFSCNISEHTDKVKHIYGDKMCNDDAQFVETLYNTPQMDVNKTLCTRESQVFGECNRIYDNESLEKILSESNSRGASPNRSLDYTDSIYSAGTYICDKTPDNKENLNIDHISPIQSKEHYVSTIYTKESNKVDQENNNLIINGKTQDDTVHSCESSIDNVFSYKQKDDSADHIQSCSPEVSSTTSEEKSTAILLKITNYKGSIVSQINGIKSDDSRPRCKFTENKDYINSNSKLSSHRPLITKGAQKYIPPLKESIRDLKVKLSLPQHSLLKLKQLKISKDEPKHHKHYSTSPRIPKKPKPKFEDVLMNIDKIQFKMHKEKNKRGKKSIPKVVIKKTENGSHYASTSSKDTFNPDLTGRKWQPWVFLEKNNFIDKMAIRGKTKAMYSHRKNTYVLAEKFHKYKSVNSTKFVISQPKCSDSSTGQLKYTIRLKHNY